MTGATSATRPEAEALVFRLPLPPNRANARGHWAAVHKAKKVYWARLDTLQVLRRVPRPPRQPFARASLAAVIHIVQLMDDDNAPNRLKWAIDWLVTRGYVADDAREVLRLADVRQVKSRRADQHLALTLTPRRRGA